MRGGGWTRPVSALENGCSIDPYERCSGWHRFRAQRGERRLGRKGRGGFVNDLTRRFPPPLGVGGDSERHGSRWVWSGNCASSPALLPPAVTLSRSGPPMARPARPSDRDSPTKAALWTLRHAPGRASWLGPRHPQRRPPADQAPPAGARGPGSRRGAAVGAPAAPTTTASPRIEGIESEIVGGRVTEPRLAI